MPTIVSEGTFDPVQKCGMIKLSLAHLGKHCMSMTLIKKLLVMRGLATLTASTTYVFIYFGLRHFFRFQSLDNVKSTESLAYPLRKVFLFQTRGGEGREEREQS